MRELRRILQSMGAMNGTAWTALRLALGLSVAAALAGLGVLYAVQAGLGDARALLHISGELTSLPQAFLLAGTLEATLAEALSR